MNTGLLKAFLGSLETRDERLSNEPKNAFNGSVVMNLQHQTSNDCIHMTLPKIALNVCPILTHPVLLMSRTIQ